MSPPQIILDQLSKSYRVPERLPGLKASLKSLVRKEYREVPAVKGISFHIQPGEVVGFIGPNGAGKTTTLKILAGLVHPTGGSAQVMGHTPWLREPDYLRRISMVMGNKSQLMWDIPAWDTFQVLGEIYRVPAPQLRQTIQELSDLLDLEPLLTRPVRNLSLGERMKCELAAALLHQPALLFLDEPTIGLDVSMQRRLRRFIADYNQRTGATIILTSHYMADVVQLCPRVILIHQGALLYDGPLAGLSRQLAPFKLIRLTLDRQIQPADLPDGLHLLEQDRSSLTFRVGTQEAPAVTARLLRQLPVLDLAVEDPAIDFVIDQIYQGGAV